MSTQPKRASEWTIHGERVVDDSRRSILSVADVELPDGVRFEQYVLRVPNAAMVVILDDDDRVLMLWRHRFIANRWVWELPGGYLDPAESAIDCAMREVEEETGWRPRSLEKLIDFQPMIGTIDQLNTIYLARGADYTGGPLDENEAEKKSPGSDSQTYKTSSHLDLLLEPDRCPASLRPFYCKHQANSRAARRSGEPAPCSPEPREGRRVLRAYWQYPAGSLVTASK